MEPIELTKRMEPGRSVISESVDCRQRAEHLRDRRSARVQQTDEQIGPIEAALGGGPQDGREDLLGLRTACGAVPATGHFARDDGRAERRYVGRAGRAWLRRFLRFRFCVAHSVDKQCREHARSIAG
jgi:hypothetical protein